MDDVGAGTAVRGTLPSCSAWREDDLREAGYDFVRWGYGRMFGQTDQTVARILRKLNG